VSFRNKLEMAIVANPLWQDYIMKHFGSLAINIKSLEDDMTIQRAHLGDMLLYLDLDVKEWYVELKTMSEANFHHHLNRKQEIVFETMGIVENNDTRSSFLESRADIYAFGFLVSNQLVLPRLFWMKETQAWFYAHHWKYRDIERPNGDKHTRFKLVPVEDIPDYCKIRPMIS